jgi:hypothetical protein
VEEAALGDFPESTGRSTVPVGPEVDNEEGKVILGAVSFGSGPGPSGTGVLATITCIAQREGSTALGLLEVQVLDTATNAQRITAEGGRVVVREETTQAPVRATTAPTSAASQMANRNSVASGQNIGLNCRTTQVLLDKSAGIAYNIINQPLPTKANPSKGGDAKPRVYVSKWQMTDRYQPSAISH